MSNEEFQTIHRTLGEIISKNLHEELFYLISFIYFSIGFPFELARTSNYIFFLFMFMVYLQPSTLEHLSCFEQKFFNR